MKRITRLLALCALAMAAVVQAHAQYYQLANQVRDLITPALTGGSSYKGSIEASVLPGIGTNRATIYGISTSQGYQYTSWFYMGAGIGVDVATSVLPTAPDGDMVRPSYFGHSTASTKAMIPIFTDFRFHLGKPSGTSVDIDLKLGATWLIGGSYLELAEKCLGSSAQFYLKPSLGVRIPVSATSSKQAIDIGLTYQLITSDRNYAPFSSTVSLNNIGVTLAYEW